MEAVDTTLDHYQKNAELFFEGTVSADMYDARTCFLCMLQLQAYILDFGCGSGRDVKAFLDQGYWVDAINGFPELCRMADDLIGQPV